MSTANVPSSLASFEHSGRVRASATERLIQAVQELSLARNLLDIQLIVRTAARAISGGDGATFVLADDGMCHYADEDAIGPLWKGMRFPMETCISGWAMLHREAVVIPDVYLDNRIPHEAYRPTFVKSLVMVPIRRIDPIGAIGIYWAEERQPSEQDVAIIQALADSTSIAMEHVYAQADLEARVRDRTAELEEANAEIRQLSLTDDLTGLYNRRGFYVLAESALLVARDHGHASVLAYLDLDGLKQVNDEAGHDVGDELIVDVANVLRAALGPSDIIARIGGDEFCVLVAEFDDSPDVLRDCLFAAFSDVNRTGARTYRLSASMGIVRVPADCTDTLEQLLALADAQMYVDKRGKFDADEETVA
jgi:diguanylate cyclase (GGDEF)-like protein